MFFRYAFIYLLLCLLSHSAYAHELTPEQVLAFVRHAVPSARLVARPALPVRAFAGEFTAASGAVSLYLLADGGYLDMLSSDIMPATIADRGTWVYDGRFLRLSSDGSLPRKYAVSSKWLPLRVRSAGAERLCLLALTDYPARKADRDKFYVFAYLRYLSKQISLKETPALRARLMQQSWNPAFFL